MEQSLAYRLLSLTLEIIPEDEHDPDPAAVHEASLIIVEALEQAGYTLTPLSTGQRGGLELFFQVLLTTTQTIGTDILAQKDAIDVLSALCAIFVTISPLVRRLFHVQKQQSPHEPSLTVSLKIDEAEITITSTDVDDDERIAHLAERLLTAHPTTKVTPQTRVSVQTRVPKTKPRHRR